MPRKKIAKRSDGRFVSTLVIGKDSEGKPIKKFFYSTESAADAKAKRDAYKADQVARGLIGAPHGEQRRVKLKVWAQRWLELKEKKVKGSTYDSSYKRPVERYIIPALGDRVMSEVLPIEIDNFLCEIGAKYSESTLQKTKMCISAIYDTAIDNGICYKNPAKNVEVKSSIEKAEKRTYSAEEAKRILDFVGSDPRGIYVRLLLELGLRCSELCGLKWSDFNLSEKTVYIQRAATDRNGAVVVGRPKSTKSIRTLPLSTALCAQIAALPQSGTDAYVVESIRRKGMPVNPKNFSAKRYKSCLDRYAKSLSDEERSKFQRLTPHELRHTCGTLLYEKSHDIYAVSKYLGHASVEITAKLYVHNSVDSMRTSLCIE